jgi:hypothetical protein
LVSKAGDSSRHKVRTDIRPVAALMEVFFFPYRATLARTLIGTPPARL